MSKQLAKILPALKPKKSKERSIESKFCTAIRELGGKAYKFTSPNHRAVLDRLVIVRGMAAMFVEFKAVGKELTDAQVRECRFLLDRSQVVFIVHSMEEADSLISYIKKHMEVV